MSFMSVPPHSSLVSGSVSTYISIQSAFGATRCSAGRSTMWLSHQGAWTHHNASSLLVRFSNCSPMDPFKIVQISCVRRTPNHRNSWQQCRFSVAPHPRWIESDQRLLAWHSRYLSLNSTQKVPRPIFSRLTSIFLALNKRNNRTIIRRSRSITGKMGRLHSIYPRPSRL
jgi:hypothetical protein